MSKNDLAPIGLSVYGRLEHLQKTIVALRGNELAQDSELYIFSDAAKHGDEEKVAAVRSYVRTIEGFKAVHVIERASNGRVNNSRGGIKSLVDKYGKVIFMAEDIVTAPGFLGFMNQALEKYERDDKIFSVVGYCPPIAFPADYSLDAFILRRFSAWGFGIWKDRFDKMRYISRAEFDGFVADKERVESFVKAGGKDMLLMLEADVSGQIDAGDVKFMYAQFLSDQYTVYPSQSLVQNIGLDGSGVHCGRTDRFDVTLSQKTKFNLPDALQVDPRIVMANLLFRDGSVG